MIWTWTGAGIGAVWHPMGTDPCRAGAGCRVCQILKNTPWQYVDSYGTYDQLVDKGAGAGKRGTCVPKHVWTRQSKGAGEKKQAVPLAMVSPCRCMNGRACCRACWPVRAPVPVRGAAAADVVACKAIGYRHPSALYRAGRCRVPHMCPSGDHC